MSQVNKEFAAILTFSRASTGTRINASGAIETVAANQPRIDYDPVTLDVRGLLVEEPRTNLLLNSLINGAPLATQSIPVAAVAHTISFFGTGSIGLSGAYTGNLSGAGAYPSRNSLTFTPVAGTLTLTITGDVKFAQCEIGIFPTSFIPTAGAQVTRAADIPSINTLSPWYVGSQGTIYSEFLIVGNIQIPAPRYVYSLRGSSVGSTVSAFVGANTNALTVWVLDGATQAESTLINAVGNIIKSAIAYRANDVAISFNGADPINDTSASIPAVNRLDIGGRLDSTSRHINGYIRKLRYYPKRLTNAELKALAA